MAQAADFDFENALDTFAKVTQNKPNKQDRVSERTVASYRRNVRYFVEWLAEERNKKPLDANTSDLRVYLQDCVANGDKDNTIITRRAAVSRFYDELPTLAEDGYIDIPPESCPDNPEEGYEGTWTVKQTHKEAESGEEIQYLPPEDVKKLWQNVPAPTLRNRLIVRMLYQTAMRVSELIQVRIDPNLKRDQHRITVPAVTSKSNSRPVAYKKTLDHLLRRWLDGGYRDAVPGAEDSPYLFPTRESPHISRESIRRIVRKAADSADLNHDIYTDTAGNTRTKVSPHILRHSMAVNTLKAGTMNVRELQEFLGHAELATTEMYLKIASDGAVEAYENKGGPPEG